MLTVCGPRRQLYNVASREYKDRLCPDSAAQCIADGPHDLPNRIERAGTHVQFLVVLSHLKRKLEVF